METRTWSLKLVILGDPSVGKTSLRRAYLGEKFRVNYISTIGADFSFKQLTLGGDKINTSIWDLAGQEETFLSIHPQYYRGSFGALVVYDVCEEESFHNVEQWIDKYQSLNGKMECPILIVGNKIDLIDSGQAYITAEQQEELVERLTEKYQGSFPILSSRTSAKTGKEINESFNKLVSEVVTWQKNKLRKEEDVVEVEMDKYIKVAYLLTFHDTYGPKVLSRSPFESGEYSNAEFGSAIKVASVLDFEDVIKHTQIIGSTPWAEPNGTFYYIAFTVDNPNARGSKSLYIVGFVAQRDIRETINKSQHIIDGYLHSTMNETVRFVTERELDLTSSDSIELSSSDLEESSKFLETLRKNVFEVIKSDI